MSLAVATGRKYEKPQEVVLYWPVAEPAYLFLIPKPSLCRQAFIIKNGDMINLSKYFVPSRDHKRVYTKPDPCNSRRILPELELSCFGSETSS